MTAEDVLRALFEAINYRDLDRLESLHADDYELVDEATGEVFRGPAGARRNNEGWLHAFPDLRWEPTNSIARGDWACVEVVGRGTHSGSLQIEGGEAAPTGRSFEIAVVTIARAENGRLVEGRDYYDRAGFLVRLGVLPERIARS